MNFREFQLGDAISRLAQMLHIPHCANCERRRVILNELQAKGVKETLERLKHCCDE